MRTLLTTLVATFLFVGGTTIAADFSFGLEGDQDGLRGFYVTIGEHFQAPEKEIVELRKRRIDDEAMPVVFFIARHTGVTCAAVLTQRERSGSWMDVAIHFGLEADVFYVPVSKDVGPPYGKAYGHYKNRKRDDWKEIRLTDSEIINFVNLSMISDHYGYPPEDIIEKRGGKHSFIDIHADIKERTNVTTKPIAADDTRSDRGAGKSKGRDKKK